MPCRERFVQLRSYLTHEALLILLTETLGMISSHLSYFNSTTITNVYQPTMESDQANPVTQTEVDIMILDYLLCIAIDTVLHGRAAKQQDQAESRGADWVLNSVHSKFKYPRKYRADAGYPSVPCNLEKDRTKERSIQIHTANRLHPPTGSTH